MKTIFRTLALATGLMLTACALLRPLGADDEARRAARITLTAYEALQQAILIYGGLPTCDAEAQLVRLCKERALWRHIKIVEATATRTIANATPVLNGQRIDAGQLVAAALAIEQVKTAVINANARLKETLP